MIPNRAYVLLLLGCSTTQASAPTADAGAASDARTSNEDAGSQDAQPSREASLDATNATDIEVFDPVFPPEPAPSATGSFASDGVVYVATDLAENGAAITSLIRDGFEYALNEPATTPQYIRGVSFQGTFFFDGHVDANGFPTYYNDCNNPLETGGVADNRTANLGLTSPTRLWSPSARTLASRAQLAFYVDPNGPTDWTDPNNDTITGTSPTCLVGKINNPKFATNNNAALSNVFLGKTVHVGDIGTSRASRLAPGIVAVDMVLTTDKEYTYAGLHPAFAGVPSTLSQLSSYDLKARTLTPAPSYGRNPLVVASADGVHALGVYTPQIALADENAGATDGYLPARFSNGVNTIMPYIRYERMRSGSYKFKSFYVAGTLAQVQASLDFLYDTFKVMSPRVFDWKFYVTQGAVALALPSPSEDQARVHWLTQGIALGLRGKADFSIQDHLAANPVLATQLGTRYYAALLHYLR
jgi:hypothetical protein